jgi:hypothetical protein
MGNDLDTNGVAGVVVGKGTWGGATKKLDKTDLKLA